MNENTISETAKKTLQESFEQFRNAVDHYIFTELSAMQKQLSQVNVKNGHLNLRNSALELENEKLKKQLEAAKKPVADPIKDEVKAININIDDETAEKLSKEIKDILDSLGSGDSFFNKLLKGF